MSDIKDIIKKDFSEAELVTKGWVARFFAKSFSGKTLAISVGVAFVMGLVVHLL
jgi:hypothetical protein